MTRLYYINKFTKIPLLLAWPYHVNMLVLEFRRFNSVLYPCWNATPKKRPTFTKICTFIEQFRNGMHSTSGYYAAPGASTGMEAPPGYYAARDAIQDNTGRDNGALYHDARSGWTPLLGNRIPCTILHLRCDLYTANQLSDVCYSEFLLSSTLRFHYLLRSCSRFDVGTYSDDVSVVFYWVLPLICIRICFILYRSLTFNVVAHSVMQPKERGSTEHAIKSTFSLIRLYIFPVTFCKCALSSSRNRGIGLRRFNKSHKTLI